MVASQDVRENHRDAIVQHYFDEFVGALKTIGYMSKAPGILDLNIEVLKNGFLEVLVAVCFLPIFYLDFHTQDLAVYNEDSEQGVALRKTLYRHPKYKEVVTKAASAFLYKGLLNWAEEVVAPHMQPH